MNKAIVSYIDNTLYKKYGPRWDDQMLRDMILKYLKPADTVLDVGAGRGRVAQMNFKGLAALVEGVDPDERVVENPLLDKGYIGLADNMPYFENERFDLIFSDNVLEHVEHPDSFMKEISRVLKPGGYFITKTPNKNHYVPLLASVTPLSFHKFINKVRGRDESDTFPTHYRLNSKKDQASWAEKNGMVIHEIKFIEGRPEYLRMFFFTYPFGIAYEKFVNGLGINGIRSVLITVFKKK